MRGSYGYPLKPDSIMGVKITEGLKSNSCRYSVISRKRSGNRSKRKAHSVHSSVIPACPESKRSMIPDIAGMTIQTPRHYKVDTTLLPRLLTITILPDQSTLFVKKELNCTFRLFLIWFFFSS